MKEINITKDTLKLIAIVAMTVDHILWIMFKDANDLVFSMHIIGRITLPIMCFFIANGYVYTKNIQKYITRMCIFTLISHFTYNYAFNIPYIPFQNGILNQTSVMYPLTLGLLFIVTMESNLKSYLKKILGVIILILSIPGDYLCLPVLMIWFMYKYRKDMNMLIKSLVILETIYSIYLFTFINMQMGIIQMFSLLVIPLLKKYTVKEEKRQVPILIHKGVTGSFSCGNITNK